MSLHGRGAGDSATPKRVRITSPRRQARPPAPTRTPGREIEEETGLGEVYVDSLLRAQLRLSLAVLGALLVVLSALPALFIFVPTVHRLMVGPIPLPWLILLALIYPFAMFLARTYVRSAERVERDFTELVHRP